MNVGSYKMIVFNVCVRTVFVLDEGKNAFIVPKERYQE